MISPDKISCDYCDEQAEWKYSDPTKKPRVTRVVCKLHAQQILREMDARKCPIEFTNVAEPYEE